MRLTVVPFLLCLVLVSGCFGPTAPHDDSDSDDPAGPGHLQIHTIRDGNVSAAPPTRVNPAGYGFEPSIQVAPDGTLYVAAAKGFTANEAHGAASPVWFSNDDGATWSELSSPLGVRDTQYGIEGDLAVDATGQLFFVDTYAADNTLTVWGPDQSWRSTRPVQGTTGADDRPWLTAHGDGIVYLLANSGSQLPDPRGGAPMGEWSAITFYASTDGGLTWSTGYPFPGSDRCGIAASPSDDATLLVGCVSRDRPGAELRAYVFRSSDRGATFEAETVAPMVGPRAEVFPTVAYGVDGTEWFSWAEDVAGTPVVRLARHVDGAAWEVADIPLQGLHVATPWMSAHPDGTLGLAFYGTEEAPSAEGRWVPYAWWAPTREGNMLLGHLVALDGPVQEGAVPPVDFLQSAIAPDGTFHVVYQRDLDPDRVVPLPHLKPDRQEIMHVQVGG